MKHNYPYLNDSKFLREVDELTNKEQFVKITVLDWNENPIQDIQGYTTGGSINLDGGSAVRRTANLSLVVDEPTNDFTRIEQLLTINKKIDLQVGYTNTTDKYTDYPIIWYPQGVYVVFNPSFSHNTSSLSMSMQLKDKMCLLNGDVGGVIPASVVLNEREDIDEKGNVIIVQPTFYQIIQEVVNHFGGEQLGKILISDVPLKVKQVMKWTGTQPLYGKRTVDNQWYFTLTETEGYIEYPYGRDIGYIYTDFIYLGELIANAGDSVCTILDKIKNTLGNFEYFYDIEGNFVFREIKNYLNTTEATTLLEQMNNNSEYLIDITRGKSVYSFNDGILVTSYSNSPQFNNIKNDFVVWGLRQGVDGLKLPIRFHLAIDEKPAVGNLYDVVFYEDESGLKKVRRPVEGDTDIKTVKATDWRSQLYLQGVYSERYAVDSNYYYTELNNEWLKVYDLVNQSFLPDKKANPYEMDFFLDFIDTSAAVGEFSVKNIGRRTKVVNDDSINCLFEPEIPDVIIIKPSSIEEGEDPNIKEAQAKGQPWSRVSSEIYDKLALGGTYNSAYNLIKDLLYQYTNYNETIQMQTIPIFHLEPNSRISVKDVKSGINGDFIIKNLSIPLSVNGTMSVSAIKALTKI